jgi:pimeloyl-ACP methyl ester carboxylesterase
MSSIDAYREAEAHFWNETVGSLPSERILHLEHLGADVRLLEHGEGPSILFLHGGPNAGSTWAPLMPFMEGYRCVMVDRPGCGLSSTALESPRAVRAYVVQLVDELLGSVDPAPSAIVASSFGSFATLAHASVHVHEAPPAVHFGCPALVPRSTLPLGFILQMLPVVGALMARMAPPPLEEARRVLKMIGHGASMDAGRVPEVLFQWYAALLEHTETRPNELELFRRIRRKDRLTDADLARVSVPMTFFWGEDDPFGGVAVAEALTRVIPEAALETVAGSGHLPWLDFPEAAGRHARAFLDEYGGLSGPHR